MYNTIIDEEFMIVFAGIWGTLMLLSLAFSVFMIICMWKVYKKAGKPGWASIIPIYNIWVLYEITGFNGALSLLILIPFVGTIIVAVLSIIANFRLAKCFGKDIGFGIGLWLLNPIFMAILAFDKSEYNKIY